jgi:hypothetical protein
MSILLAFQSAPPAEPDFIIWVEAVLQEEPLDLLDLSEIIPIDALAVAADLIGGIEADLPVEGEVSEGLTTLHIEDDPPAFLEASPAQEPDAVEGSIENLIQDVIPPHDGLVDQALDYPRDELLADAQVADLFIPEDDPILVRLDEPVLEVLEFQGYIDGPIENPTPPPDPNFLIYSLEAPETLDPPNHADILGLIEPTVVDEPPFIPIMIPSDVVVRPHWLSRTKFVFYVERK